MYWEHITWFVPPSFFTPRKTTLDGDKSMTTWDSIDTFPVASWVFLKHRIVKRPPAQTSPSAKTNLSPPKNTPSKICLDHSLLKHHGRWWFSPTPFGLNKLSNRQIGNLYIPQFFGVKTIWVATTLRFFASLDASKTRRFEREGPNLHLVGPRNGFPNGQFPAPRTKKRRQSRGWSPQGAPDGAFTPRRVVYNSTEIRGIMKNTYVFKGLPSRELTYPTWGKWKSSSKSVLVSWYVNFQECILQGCCCCNSNLKTIVGAKLSLWIQVPPKKVLYPPNCTLSAFLAATWIHRVYKSRLLSQLDEDMFWKIVKRHGQVFMH